MLPTAQPSRLSATDRCDRCGAQAVTRVEFRTGSALLFCARHTRQHEVGLREVAVRISDHPDCLGTVLPVPRSFVHPSQRRRL
ncbi:MAG: hypothetical protein ACJ71Z_04460 [Aeromicrobium sp.]